MPLSGSAHSGSREVARHTRTLWQGCEWGQRPDPCRGPAFDQELPCGCEEGCPWQSALCTRHTCFRLVPPGVWRGSGKDLWGHLSCAECWRGQTGGARSRKRVSRTPQSVWETAERRPSAHSDTVSAVGLACVPVNAEARLCLPAGRIVPSIYGSSLCVEARSFVASGGPVPRATLSSSFKSHSRVLPSSTN